MYRYSNKYHEYSSNQLEKRQSAQNGTIHYKIEEKVLNMYSRYASRWKKNNNKQKCNLFSPVQLLKAIKSRNGAENLVLIFIIAMNKNNQII
jgi:hypothetical protein